MHTSSVLSHPRHRSIGHTAARHTGRPAMHSLVLVMVIGFAATGCAATISPAADLTASVTPTQCVQAVFTVLTGMVTKPLDGQPFDDFVNRYGTASAAYTAYRDTFDEFYAAASQRGVPAAVQDVHGMVSRDCANSA